MKTKWPFVFTIIFTLASTAGHADDDGSCVHPRHTTTEQTREPSNEDIEEMNIGYCHDTLYDEATGKRKRVKVGFKCRVRQKDGIYERVAHRRFGEAWKGPDGLIWSDYLGRSSQGGAKDSCQNRGGRLPTREDFERGSNNAFSLVLTNWKETWARKLGLHIVSIILTYEVGDYELRYFWTSTPGDLRPRYYILFNSKGHRFHHSMKPTSTLSAV